MLRKFAVALLAASVFTAPVFAQGNGAPTTPPAKTEVKKDSAPKVVNAKPAHKSAKLKTSKRYARHHAKHATHVAHVKRVEHVKSAQAEHGAKGDKQVRHVVSKSANGATGTNGANGSTTAPKAKTNVN